MFLYLYFSSKQFQVENSQTSSYKLTYLKY